MAHRSRRLILAATAAATVVVAGVAVTRPDRSTQDDSSVQGPTVLEFEPADLATIERRAWTVALQLPGTVQALSQATVRAKTSAEVRRVLFREGDRVAAGQIVAEFDVAALRQVEAERRAALDSARAQLAQSERTRDANAALLQQGFISTNAFASAEASFRAQLAAVDAGQAQLAQVRLQLSDAIVRAPIGGLVAKRDVQPGEKVAFDAPLLTIVDLSRLEVQAQAPVSEVARIAIGAPATVDVDGADGTAPVVGRVERINPSADAGSRTIAVYVSIPNPEQGLRSGMFAHIRLASKAGAPTATLVASAVHAEGSEAYVWVFTGDRIVRRSVRTGRRDDREQRVEILGGLGDSERVVALHIDAPAEEAPARLIDATPAALAARAAAR